MRTLEINRLAYLLLVRIITKMVLLKNMLINVATEESDKSRVASMSYVNKVINLNKRVTGIHQMYL